MRTLSAALLTHFDQECTTLATCWQIQRKDGKKFFFTDHDSDIVFLTNTHKSNHGYNRTATSTSASFETDEFDINGFFNSGSLVLTDIQAGHFDFAEVSIFVVNFEDLTQGSMVLKRGTIGEVSSTPSGAFKAEFRGLMQRYSQKVGEKYQPECRTDLGSKKCKFPINPPIVQRDTAYTAGQFVRVATDTGAATQYSLGVVNGGFELGEDSSWQTSAALGSIIFASAVDLDPRTGTKLLKGLNYTDSFDRFQSIDVTALGDYNEANVDAGNVFLTGSVWCATSAAFEHDRGNIRVEAFDENAAQLSVIWETGFEAYKPDLTWINRSVADAVLPVGTRSILITLEGSRESGAVTNIAFDDVVFSLIDTTGATGIQEIYENTIYEVTTEGTTASTEPAYTTTPAATTVDGTATFTAYESVVRHAVVAGITDRHNFTITVDETRAADDWFNQGGVMFETGENKGQVTEIKTWSRTVGDQITTFLPLPYNIAIGDKIIVFAGCDKRLSTCTTKFAMAGSVFFSTGNFTNFRGEPYIPAIDAILEYADSLTPTSITIG